MRMTIDEVKDIINRSITNDDRASKAYYIDKKIHPAGEDISLGKTNYHLDSDSVIIFIDEEPGKNWDHKCRYLVFDIYTNEFNEIREKYPPSLTVIPGNFEVISKPEGFSNSSFW